MKRLLLTCALGLLALAAPASASAATVWDLDLHHNPTNFEPGAIGEYWVDAANLGATDSSGTVTVTIDLPAGQTRQEVLQNQDPGYTNPNQWGVPGATPLEWSCPGSVGDTEVTCTTSQPIYRHTLSRGLVIAVDVAPGPATDRIAFATLDGGGAAQGASTIERVRVDPAPAPFGILAPSFEPEFTEADGLTPERVAGSRPELLTVPFDFTSVLSPHPQNPLRKAPAENPRNLTVDLPPGFLGDLTAIGECSAADFTLGQCPASSQVGRIEVRTLFVTGTDGRETGFSTWTRGIFNITHPLGKVADMGFEVASNPIHIETSLDPARGYAISTTVPNINETAPPFDNRLTVWGVPVDPAHDSERCLEFNKLSGKTLDECASDGPLQPFLTLPFQCDTDTSIRIHSYDSWENTGDFGPDIVHQLPGQFTNCEDVPFQPDVTVTPTTNAAGSASGLDVTISVPQHNSCTQIDPAPPAGEAQLECPLATSPLKDATVTLPEGLAVNPAGANGLGACTEAEISLGTDDPIGCPDASRIATVEVQTPLLPDPVEGVVYLATPHENPFGTLLAGYIVLSDPSRGLLVKIPGRIDVDEGTGQITGTFNKNPQLPFSEFELHFKGGAHSSLTTPPACGEFAGSADFDSWSGKAHSPAVDAFAITEAPGGGSCPTSEAALPHAPDLDAGTITPIAGQHSPFVVNLRREDGTQRFSTVKLSPPPGLTAKLAGTPYCPDSALAAAENRDGKAEQSDPSCPAASRIGAVHAAAGAGPDPYWAKGAAYLAGPYEGAPLSMAIVTPAVAGPFDLGVVVIRTALHVDPVTAQITAVSDPIPEFLQGIPLDIREASIRLDKPEFTLNPTSCNEMTLGGELTSTTGAKAELSERFQLGECKRLGFKPRLFLRLYGKRFTRSSNPRLRAVLVPRPGDANIAFASVKMPNSIFLDQDHIRTVCTRAQFATETCPKGSIYGKAAASTPLLSEPLRGNVYLRSSDNPLPDLVSDLQGQVSVQAVGRTDSVKGALRNTFDIVPDAPVSKFVLLLQPGPKSLLVASRNLCRGPQRALILMRAHNGRASLTRQPINIPRCRAIRKAAKRRTMRRKRARQRAKRRGARRASISAARLTG